MELTTLIQTLQASIAPCVLISGFGFLLLTMSNRLGRSIDRVRELDDSLEYEKESRQARIKEQIKILFQRCEILQLAITLVICCVLCVSLIVLLLFLSLKFHLPLSNVIEIFFTLNLILLMFALALFLLDIRKGLHSVRIELNNR